MIPKTVIFVTGRQGSGKTHICTSNKYHVLPGKALRAKYGEKFFANVKENPSAPQETEVEVRRIITEAISELPECEVLYVDGFPRKPQQVQWIRDIAIDTHIQVRVMIVTCNERTRTERLKLRDCDDADKVSLILAREKTEGGLLLDTITSLSEYGIPYTVIPNNGTSPMSPSYAKSDDSCPYVSPNTNLRKIFELHKQLLDIGGSKFPDDSFKTEDNVVAGSLRAKAIRDMFKHTAMECQELMELIPDKAWMIPDLTTEVAKLRVEAIDVFHFLLSGFMALGMTADDVARIYDGKRRINIDRQTKGYIATKSKEKDGELGRC